MTEHPTDLDPLHGPDATREADAAHESEAVEDLMADCFAGPEQAWPEAIERLAAKHPDHADEIRERFERGLAFESIVPEAEHLPEIRRELGRLNAARE